MLATAFTSESGPPTEVLEAAGVAKHKDDTTAWLEDSRVSRLARTDLTDCGRVPPTLNIYKNW